VLWTDPTGECIAYGNRECELVRTWSDVEDMFPYAYPRPVVESATLPKWTRSSPRQVAEWAATFDVVSNDPRFREGAYPIGSLQWGEAELFATYFLGFSLVNPNSPYLQGLQTELDCLDRKLADDTATAEDVTRRLGILGAFGLLSGQDLFSPDGGRGGGGRGREIVLPKYQYYEQARNRALELLGPINPATREDVVGRLPASRGRGLVVGFETEVNGVWKRYRLDYDPNRGAHINVEIGKGSKAERFVIPWNGNEEDFLRQVRSIQ